MKDRNKLRKLKAEWLKKSTNTKRRKKKYINKEKQRKRKVQKNELKIGKEMRKIPVMSYHYTISEPRCRPICSRKDVVLGHDTAQVIWSQITLTGKAATEKYTINSPQNTGNCCSLLHRFTEFSTMSYEMFPLVWGEVRSTYP